MRISVVVPVHNAAKDLQQCLQSIASSTRLPDEVVVVDDASTDNSAQVAQGFIPSLSVQVLTTGNQARGPAFARNRGIEAAAGDIVLFLDADVCLHADALARIERCFTEEPDVAALFGSYDDAPRAHNLVSGYVNLRHHWTHQHASREAWTFWSGIGAIRRAVFCELGGFDESYARPSIEDIALGRKLRLAGHRVLVCPDVQGTHLKRWTVRSWLRTDIRDRAIPWTRLMLSDKSDVPSDLNLDWKSRVSAIVAWLSVALFVAALVSSQKTSLLMLCGAAFVALAALNWPLLRFFSKRRGVLFAFGAFWCHALYFLYSSATFGLLVLGAKLQFVLARPRNRVLVLLLAALFKGLAWSLIVPPWQAPDEPQHFLYAHEIVQQRTTDIMLRNAVPRDAWQLSILAPEKRVAEGLPFDFSNRLQIQQTLRDIDSEGFRAQTVLDGKQLISVPTFVSFHPPAYYFVLSRILEPLQTQSIRWRLLAGRWLSVSFGVLTVAFSVLLARETWPHRPDWALLLGTLVAFQPMNAFTQAAITDDAPLILLSTALLWLALRVLRLGMTTRRGVMMGIVVAAGLLVKMSFACVVPLLGALMLWRSLREGRVVSRMQMSHRRHRKTHSRGRSLSRLCGWAFVFLLPFAGSSWWYRGALGGGSTGLIQSSFVDKKIDGGKTSSKAPYYSGLGWEGTLRKRLGKAPVLAEIVVYVRVLISYWGNFGWSVNVRLPSALWIFLSLFSMAVTAITARGLLRQSGKSSTRSEEMATRRQRRALWWLGAATFVLLLFYAVVDWRTRASTGGSFGLRGGYYLPAIAAQMAWLLTGAIVVFNCLQVPRVHFAWLAGGAMIVLNLGCLLGVVAPRYYGTGALWPVIESATVLQPVSPLFLALICAATVLSSTLLVVALRLAPPIEPPVFSSHFAANKL